MSHHWPTFFIKPQKRRREKQLRIIAPKIKHYIQTCHVPYKHTCFNKIGVRNYLLCEIVCLDFSEHFTLKMALFTYYQKIATSSFHTFSYILCQYNTHIMKLFGLTPLSWITAETTATQPCWAGHLKLGFLSVPSTGISSTVDCWLGS